MLVWHFMPVVVYLSLVSREHLSLLGVLELEGGGGIDGRDHRTRLVVALHTLIKVPPHDLRLHRHLPVWVLLPRTLLHVEFPQDMQEYCTRTSWDKVCGRGDWWAVLVN